MECFLCFDILTKSQDIKLNCCGNFIHKKCFNKLMSSFLTCPLCREFILLEMPKKKLNWFCFCFENKNKNTKKRTFIVESQNNMIYTYSDSDSDSDN